MLHHITGTRRGTAANLFSYFMGKGSKDAMKGSGGGADTALSQSNSCISRVVSQPILCIVLVLDA